MENAQILTELYEVIKQNTPDQYARIIRERASYSFLYHLSEIRQNLIGWLPIDATKRVLECNPAYRKASFHGKGSSLSDNG